MTAREEGSGFYGFNRFNRFNGFNGFNRGGAAHKKLKRRGVLIALRAFDISSVAEKSLWHNAHCLM